MKIFILFSDKGLKIAPLNDTGPDLRTALESAVKMKKLLQEKEVFREMGLDYGDYDAFEDMKKALNIYKAQNGITSRPKVPKIIRQNEEMKKLGKSKKFTKNKSASLPSSVSSLKLLSSPQSISPIGFGSNSLKKVIKMLGTNQHMLEEILRLAKVGTNNPNTTRKTK